MYKPYPPEPVSHAYNAIALYSYLVRACGEMAVAYILVLVVGTSLFSEGRKYIKLLQANCLRADFSSQS